MADAPTDPTPLAVPTVGLLASARTPTTGSDTETLADGETVRWVQGFSWSPEDCTDTATLVAACGTAGPDTTPTVPDDRTFLPYVITASVRCSTFGNASESQIDQMQRRALAKLSAIEQTAIEGELWEGTWAQAEGNANNYLTDSATWTELQSGAAVGLVTALAELEQAIADTLPSGRGMIHATARTVTLWARNGLVTRRGDTLVTLLDTIVVPGRGYTGTAPGSEGPGDAFTDEDFSWAYATDLVTVRRGQAFLLTDDVTSRAAVDRTANTILVSAARFASATWDGCLHTGLLVDHRSELTSIGS